MQYSDAALGAIASLLFGVDERGVVKQWNHAAEEMFGVPAAAALGKPLTELEVEWLEPDTVRETLRLRNNDKKTRLSLRLIRDGATRIIGVSMYPFSYNDNERGALILGADITEKLELEEQLAQARKLEAVGQLAAGVAHEINTPMQYLGDNLDFLRSKMEKLTPVLESFPRILQIAADSDQDPELIAAAKSTFKKLKAHSFAEQVGEAIHDSQEGVQHVSRIVQAMKEFAHPGQDEKAPVDINRALDSTIAVSTNEWKYVADIHKDYDPSIPLVHALAGELNQVFLNLLVNAAHAVGDTNNGGAKGKGAITIATRLAGDFVEVSIADSGSGIPEHIQQRIFDPFFTTKEVGKGTGQGLAIAHSVVVKEHGGKLRFTSTPGKGATFFVELPIKAREALDDMEAPAVEATRHEATIV